MESKEMAEVPKILVQHGVCIGSVRFSTNVAGTTFIPDSAKLLGSIKESVSKDEIVITLEKEPENPYDARAVRVDISIKGSIKKYKIGYIPKQGNELLSYVLTYPDKYDVEVSDISLVGGEGKKKNIGVFFDYRVFDKSAGDLSLGDGADSVSLDLDNFFE